MTPSDPLNQGPNAERELFTRFSQLAHGFPRDVVLGAVVNILLNTIRQEADTKAKAEVQFDELFGKVKAILLAHYDGTGKRRSVFPFNQNIEVPLVRFLKK